MESKTQETAAAPGWDERAFSTEVAEWPAGKSVQPARRKTRRQPRKQPICSRRKT